MAFQYRIFHRWCYFIASFFLPSFIRVFPLWWDQFFPTSLELYFLNRICMSLELTANRISRMISVCSTYHCTHQLNFFNMSRTFIAVKCSQLSNFSTSAFITFFSSSDFLSLFNIPLICKMRSWWGIFL